MTVLLQEKEIYATTLAIPHPYKEEDALAWIRQHSKKHDNGEAFTWCLEERKEKKLIGSLEIIFDQRNNKAEIGYWVGKPYWNQGYTTEASKEVIHFAFEELKLNKVCAHHMSRNPASGQVLKKLGMEHEGTLKQSIKKDGVFEDTEVYGLLNPRYPKGSVLL